MTEFQQYNKAVSVAIRGHYYQTRRDGKTPYMYHVNRVVDNVRARNTKRNFIAEAVAYLHDVVEEYKYTKTSLQDLRKLGFSDEVIDAVDALTHREGESYEEAILRAKANPIARQVKIADNLANLSDTPTDKQIIKYAKSLQVLMTDD